MIFVLAPLIRGLCINAAQAPRIVLAGTGEPPHNALSIDLESAYRGGGEDGNAFDEEAAAKALSEAYAAFEFEISPSGGIYSEMVKKQPSSIVIKRGAETLGFFWIDRDLEAVKRRMDNKDDSFIEDILPPALDYSAEALMGRTSTQDTEKVLHDLSSSDRSNVVKNKVAVVTGGAQGLGEQICIGLASSGALVFIADKNLEGAENLAKKINSVQKRTAAIAVKADVTSEESIEQLFATIVKEAGGLDLCISNAGVLRAGSVIDQDLASFSFTTEVNYTGYFIVTKFASRLLRLQHLSAPRWKTDIIQINSKSGLEGSNKNGAYAGSKFGGLGLTSSFALELIDYNIKVNSVCPGNLLNDPLWADPENGLLVQYLKEGKVIGARTVDEVRAFYEAKVPMKRGCDGADVMRAIYYIVEQEYETGQALPVTGGQIMLH